MNTRRLGPIAGMTIMGLISLVSMQGCSKDSSTSSPLSNPTSENSVSATEHSSAQTSNEPAAEPSVDLTSDRENTGASSDDSHTLDRSLSSFRQSIQNGEDPYRNHSWTISSDPEYLDYLLNHWDSAQWEPALWQDVRMQAEELRYEDLRRSNHSHPAHPELFGDHSRYNGPEVFSAIALSQQYREFGMDQINAYFTQRDNMQAGLTTMFRADEKLRETLIKFALRERMIEVLAFTIKFHDALLAGGYGDDSWYPTCRCSFEMSPALRAGIEQRLRIPRAQRSAADLEQELLRVFGDDLETKVILSGGSRYLFIAQVPLRLQIFKIVEAPSMFEPIYDNISEVSQDVVTRYTYSSSPRASGVGILQSPLVNNVGVIPLNRTIYTNPVGSFLPLNAYNVEQDCHRIEDAITQNFNQNHDAAIVGVESLAAQRSAADQWTNQVYERLQRFLRSESPASLRALNGHPQELRARLQDRGVLPLPASTSRALRVETPNAFRISSWSGKIMFCISTDSLVTGSPRTVNRCASLNLLFQEADVVVEEDNATVPATGTQVASSSFAGATRLSPLEQRIRETYVNDADWSEFLRIHGAALDLIRMDRAGLRGICLRRLQ